LGGERFVLVALGQSPADLTTPTYVREEREQTAKVTVWPEKKKKRYRGKREKTKPPHKATAHRTEQTAKRRCCSQDKNKSVIEKTKGPKSSSSEAEGQQTSLKAPHGEGVARLPKRRG